MSALAIATMATICTLVWGGFLTLLTRAVRREGAKSRARRRGPGPSG